jgi:hypothetical protein
MRLRGSIPLPVPMRVSFDIDANIPIVLAVTSPRSFRTYPCNEGRGLSLVEAARGKMALAGHRKQPLFGPGDKLA